MGQEKKQRRGKQRAGMGGGEEDKGTERSDRKEKATVLLGYQSSLLTERLHPIPRLTP